LRWPGASAEEVVWSAGNGCDRAGIAGVYIALATVNIYLDFLFPLELYFLHIAYEVGSHRLHAGLHSHSHAQEGVFEKENSRAGVNVSHNARWLRSPA
jgi:hypothetical protein